MDESLRACFLCMDCSKDTHESNEYYALHDRLWRKIQPTIVGMLCLQCAERRLGRDLVAADFSSAPINAENAEICPTLALRLALIFVS